MNLPTARKIASKAIVTPSEMNEYQRAKATVRAARKRRRQHVKKGRA